MARHLSRSARSGRFVKTATVRRHPSTTTTETVGKGTSNSKTVHRSASSGKFVTESTARRHPDKTINQRV
jgi:hypothetical protein